MLTIRKLVSRAACRQITIETLSSIFKFEKNQICPLLLFLWESSQDYSIQYADRAEKQGCNYLLQLH